MGVVLSLSPTSAIISAQLLCFRGTINSSTSSSAIQSYLCLQIFIKCFTFHLIDFSPVYVSV